MLVIMKNMRFVQILEPKNIHFKLGIYQAFPLQIVLHKICFIVKLFIIRGS